MAGLPGDRMTAGRWLARTLFGSRWLAAPLYVMLAAALAILLIRFALEAWLLLLHTFSLSEDGIIIAILSLVDLSLVANLIVMVIFAGYENFVARMDLEQSAARPEWMGHIGFGDLKVKLMTSIVAISAIHLLENFMNVDHLSSRDLAWATGLHLAFVLSALALALMDRITDRA